MKISNLKPILLIILLFILLIAIFFGKAFLGYKPSASNLTYHVSPWKNVYDVKVSGPLLSDPADAIYPILHEINQDLRDGKFDFWESSISLGQSNTFSVISRLFYLFNYIVFLFPPEQVETGWFFEKAFLILLSLIGMYLVLNTRKLKKPSCILGAIIYTFCGTNVVWMLWPHTSVTFLAPLFFYFFEKAVFDKQIKSFICSSLILATMFFAGMPYYVAIFLCLIGFYFLYRVIKNNNINIEFSSQILIFGLIVIIGTGLAFISLNELLSNLNSTGYYDIRTGSYKGGLPHIAINELFFPKSIKLPMHYNEYSFYVGSIGTIFYLMSFLFMKDDKEISFWFIMCSLILVVLFTPVLDPLLKYIPIINSTIKSRMVILFCFSNAMLSAYVLNGFINKIVHKRTFYILVGLVIGLFGLDYWGINNEITSFKYFYFGLFTAIYILTVLSISLFTKNKKWLSYAICSIALLQIFSLGMGYIPYVEKESELFPSTSSIEFLQRNADYHRIVAIGAWTLYPNIPQAYNLYDFRGHHFGNVDPDYKNLSLAIDNSSIRSRTRNTINKIDDLDPLSLVGVKYVLYDSMPNVKIFESGNLEQKPLDLITKGIVVSQKFSLNHNSIDNINILFSTHHKLLDGENNLFFKLQDYETGKVLREQAYPLNVIKDNRYFSFEFEPLINVEGKILNVILSTNAPPENAPTLWVTKDIRSEFPLCVNDEERENSMMLNYSYSLNNEIEGLEFIKKFDDGMYLYENIKALDVVYISRNYEIKQDLDYSNLDYEPMIIDRKIYIDKDYGYKIDNIPINADEYVNFNVYDDSNVEIEAYTIAPSFIIFSDTYDENWHVYVNGAERPVIKVNDLFKGVYVDKGKSNVQFMYKGVGWNEFIIPCISLVALIIIFLVWNKIFK